jgi:hypothetical protein
VETRNHDLDGTNNYYFDTNNYKKPHNNKSLTSPATPNNSLNLLINNSLIRSRQKKKKKKEKKKLKSTTSLQDIPPTLPSMSKSKDSMITDCVNVVESNNSNSQIFATSDTGATGTYLKSSDVGALQDITLSSAVDQIVVAVADGTLLKSTHHGFLNIPGHGKIIAHVLPRLKTSLLSVSQLVDLGLRVTYCDKWVKSFDKNNNIILQGPRDTKSGLWKVDLQQL